MPQAECLAAKMPAAAACDVRRENISGLLNPSQDTGTAAVPEACPERAGRSADYDLMQKRRTKVNLLIPPARFVRNFSYFCDRGSNTRLKQRLLC